MKLRKSMHRLKIALLILCVPGMAYAYVDAGTGAYVVQLLITLVGVLAFYVGKPFRAIKLALKKWRADRENERHHHT